VDSWLLELKQQVTKSLHDMVLSVASDCSSGVPFEEWVLKVSGVISHISLNNKHVTVSQNYYAIYRWLCWLIQYNLFYINGNHTGVWKTLAH